jgi:uncharacterized damage-inducible protein DinB
MDHSLTPVEKAAPPADVASEPEGGEQDSGLRQAVEAAVDFLGQGEALLLVVAPEDYTHKFAIVFGASIGSHYRHCLDHFVCLLNGKDLGLVDYDQRERDAQIETQPARALEATRRIRTALRDMQTGVMARSISTRCSVSYGERESPVTRSSLARELVFVVTHGIHHFALISVMARLLDAALPPEFGVAPSTVAHRMAILAAETDTP